MDDRIIENAIEFVKKTFENDYSGHDYFHTLRVYRTATHIAEREKADLITVQLAALLHDVDDIKLSPQTHKYKDRAVGFLRSHGVADSTVETVCKIIDEVSFKGTDSVSPQTLEGMCVQDADRLDAIGAIGIARAFAFGGNHNRVMHDPSVLPMLNMNEEQYRNSKSTTINHFYEKLFSLGALMNTATAKEIAARREQYMKAYVEEFLDEWDGKK